MEMETELEESECDSEFSGAYEGDISLVESSASVEICDAAVSESEAADSAPLVDMANSSLVSRSLSPYSSADSYLRRVKQPKSLISSRSDLRRQVVHARLQAELIRAQSKIVQLESELSHQRNLTEHAQIRQNDSHATTAISDITNGSQVERLHQLDKERCDLLEELQTFRDKLSSAEKELEQKSCEIKQLSTNYDKQTKSLNEQITKLEIKNEELENECERLSLDVTIAQSEKTQTELSEVEELQFAHEKSIQVLRNRIEELEVVESELVRSEARERELERKLRSLKHNESFLLSQQQKLINYDELDRQIKHLTEENGVLKSQQDNADLLRYRVQTLQEKCAKYEGIETKVAQLELENKHLEEKVKQEITYVATSEREVEDVKVDGGNGGGTQAALWYKIAQLQQKEVLLTVKQGELMTRLTLAQSEAADTKKLLEEVRGQLAKEQSDSHSKDEHIQRLEKRLTFVTKERDGCLNVLKSYKLDSGVDALLKENLNELEQQLARANERITELETSLQAT